MIQAENRKIQLILSMDASRGSIFRKVHLDKKRMLQILLNFISNSLKFTKQQGFVKVHLKLLEEQELEEQFKLNSKRSLKRTYSMQSPTKRTPNILNQQQIPIQKYIKVQIIVEDNGVGIS